MKEVLFLLIFLFSNYSIAAQETSSSSTVSKIFSYSQYGDGDVVVVLEQNGTTCSSGYWLKRNDPGFQSNLSMVIAAYQTKNLVTLSGHTDQIWAGSSSGKFCLMYSVGYQ